MQIVESRLAELQHKADLSQVDGMAAHISRSMGLQIRRGDLAAWDASARASLEVANQAKRREDTQLKPIIDNIPSVTRSGTTYADFLKTWTKTMLAVHNAINGTPQDESNGVVLLGLLSWHMYPDLQVFNPNKVVVFHDSLVKPGGVITLGLENLGETDGGVKWSLSLSHLRHYGDPVFVEGSMHDGDRLTIQKIRFVAFDRSYIHGAEKNSSASWRPRNASWRWDLCYNSTWIRQS
ncbi:hypothetical protein CTRI78_v009973 [Colletotrichum trifolii]|uniref:Uncharacterized protein n=1 Tax=Colletotrichum trifolii TaxID=5466 RepID=A0A4R8QPB8_COLTR|nr:hypothetical protein CTRI78_v009973 [Colletotrichum trifolii]